MKKILSIAILLFSLSVPSELFADTLNIESGLPITLEDAYVTPFMNREYHMFLEYSRSADDEDVLDVVQRLEGGIWYNTEITVEAPFEFGEGIDDGYGDTSVEFLYNLNQENKTLPALSLGATLITPTGRDSEGVDPEVEAILTKTIPGTWDLHRLHLNGGFRFNDDVQQGEREGLCHVVFGYSFLATNELVLLTDILHRQEIEEDIETNLIEAGARYALTPRITVSAGAGVGFGDDSPDVKTTLGIQVVF